VTLLTHLLLLLLLLLLLTFLLRQREAALDVVGLQGFVKVSTY
tara:strand:- start:273 stop:401 length:129 start_codon:yes stop_codon:yes gene_type:complete